MCIPGNADSLATYGFAPVSAIGGKAYGQTLKDGLVAAGWISIASVFQYASAMRTTPERVAALRSALLELNGKKKNGDTISVGHTASDCKGDEYECRHYGQEKGAKVPAWWPGPALNGIEWLGYEKSGSGSSRGVNYVISEPEGVVYAVIWRT